MRLEGGSRRLLCIFVKPVLKYPKIFCCVWTRTHNGHFLGLTPSPCSIISLLTVAPGLVARSGPKEVSLESLVHVKRPDASVVLEDVG